MNPVIQKVTPLHQLSTTPPNYDYQIKAKDMQGWLEKKGGISWQRRFFLIVESEATEYVLAYFEKNTDQKPKGSIRISDISEIIAEGDKEFVLYYTTKNFKLRASTSQERTEWMTGLIHLKKYAQTQNGIRKASLSVQGGSSSSLSVPDSPLSKRGSVAFDSKDQHRKSITSKGGHKIIDSNLLSKICAEKEERVSEVQEQSSKQQSLRSAEEIFEKLGLEQYIEAIKPKEVISNRMIYGYLKKMSKSMQKSGYTRFFILVSSKPLYPQKGYNDERILTSAELPPWMDLDKIYFFDAQKIGDGKKPSKDVNMQKVIEVKQFDSQQSLQEKGFMFIVSEENRLFKFSTNTETDRQRWIQALDVARTTALEIKKGGGQIKKNIDMIVKIYDSGDTNIKKRENLRKKIDAHLINMLIEHYGSEIMNDSVFTLTNYLTDVSEDMKNVMEACLFKEPVRNDIIKEYTDYVHEKICEDLKNYWDKNHEKTSNEGVLTLSKFLHDYIEKTRRFLKDPRIEEAINTLLNIYASRNMQISEETIANIIEKQKRDVDPVLQEDEDYLYSSVPVDLFKLINISIDTGYRMCPTTAFLKAVGKFAQYTISFYQDSSQEALEDDTFNEKQLVILCNNTVKFEEQLKDFSKRVKNLGGFSEEEVEEQLRCREIVKQFLTISNNAYNQIASLHLSQLRNMFAKKSYLETNLEELFNQIFEGAQATTQIFFVKYQKKLWKDILDYLILFYFQTMIQSCKKAKKEHLQQYITKIEADAQYLQSQFSEVLFKKSLEQSLAPFESMQNILESEDGTDVQKDIKKLRIAFGFAFTHRTVAYIFALRKDLSKEDIDYVVNTSESTIMQYNKEHENDEVQRIDIGKTIEVLGIDLDSEQPEQLEEEQQETTRAKKKTITMSLNDSDDDRSTTNSISSSLIDNKKLLETPEKPAEEFIEEGYLFKRKPDKFVYDKRYFRLRDNGLYWYTTESSQDVQNKIEIEQIDEVIPDTESQNLFDVTLHGVGKKKGKIYKFKTENAKERDLWMRSIRKCIQNLDEKNVKENVGIEAITVEGKVQKIIMDYEEIKRKQRAMQMALERKRKQEEKEERARQMTMKLKKEQEQEQRIAPSMSITELRTSTSKSITPYNTNMSSQFHIIKNNNNDALLPERRSRGCLDDVKEFFSSLFR